MRADECVLDLLNFLDESPTAAHATELVSNRLSECGFIDIDECSDWRPEPGQKFCMVRSGAALVAGVIGSADISDAGARIIGAHTDFPGFRIKPLADRMVDGMNTVSVEVYGSPILATWFDRDLSLAGSLVVKEDSNLVRKSFVVPGPVCRISSPAIHLQRNLNKEGFKIDPEKHTPMILSSSGSGLDHLVRLACDAACISKDDVLGWSMEVFDSQKAVIGGVSGDFIFSGRLDNLQMCHAAMRALMNHGGGEPTAIIALFNSEEVGSNTLNGAGSGFLDSILERLAGGRFEFMRTLRRSVLVSADGAHGVHPNYEKKHDGGCRPVLGGGPVIKINVSNKYTSTDLTTAYFRSCAEKAGVDVQYFVSRNDMPCGSTIGPMLSSRTGMNSVDVGNALLSMHSVREMCGSGDHVSMIRTLEEHLGSGTGISG